MNTRWAAAAVCVGLGLTAGCGRMSPVSGTVTYADGQPLDRGTIEFELVAEKQKDRVSALGTIGSGGAFTLSTHAEADGALQGEYRVAVFPPVVLPPDPGVAPPPPFRPFPKKYQSVETSGLTATVQPGRNEFTFVLK